MDMISGAQDVGGFAIQQQIESLIKDGIKSLEKIGTPNEYLDNYKDYLNTAISNKEPTVLLKQQVSESLARINATEDTIQNGLIIEGLSAEQLNTYRDGMREEFANGNYSAKASDAVKESIAQINTETNPPQPADEDLKQGQNSIFAGATGAVNAIKEWIGLNPEEVPETLPTNPAATPSQKM